MNRGVLQSSPVQQLMAGNPNWWTMRPPPQQPSPFLSSPSNLFPQFTPTSSSLPNLSSWHENQELPDSWSQLLLGGLVGEEDKSGLSHFQAKKFENWENQVLHQAPNASVVDVKHENSSSGYVYGHGNEEFQAAKPTWSQVIPVSSPKSCVTSFSSNMLDFSNKKADGRHPPPDRSSECNSTATGGALKKARVQPSSAQSTFKVRTEKLGDRITALHQLVSPFGKTDTASVLLEAIGYIRFLQSQIEALSLPYMGTGSGNIRHQQSVETCEHLSVIWALISSRTLEHLSHIGPAKQVLSHLQVQGGERNCIFPEDPGQLLNDNCMKNKGASEQDSHEESKDLRSRGLCLVPVSCTLQVGSDNGADYWAPALGGGF